MLKRLLCILLVTMLTVSAVSCRRGPSPTDQGEATDAATLPTTTTAEDDTASDEPFPTDPNVRSHFSDLSLNDVSCFDGTLTQQRTGDADFFAVFQGFVQCNPPAGSNGKIP